MQDNPTCKVFKSKQNSRFCLIDPVQYVIWFDFITNVTRTCDSHELMQQEANVVGSLMTPVYTKTKLLVLSAHELNILSNL